PANGILSYTWQAFDVGGNRTQSRQYSSTNGAVQLWATNFSTFDGLHRPFTEVTGDRATRTNYYNAANNLTDQYMPGGLSWHATYNTAAQKLKEYDLGSSGAGTRTNS